MLNAIISWSYSVGWTSCDIGWYASLNHSPTSVRRTVSVCPIGLHPRVPQRAGGRSGRPSWVPADTPSCRGVKTLVVVRSQKTLTNSPLAVLFEINQSVTGCLWAHMRRTAGGPYCPFAIPEALPLQTSPASSQLARSLAARAENSSEGFPRCAPKVWSVFTGRVGGGTIWVAPLPHPKTYTIHTQCIHLLACSRRRKEVCVSESFTVL